MTTGCSRRRRLGIVRTVGAIAVVTAALAAPATASAGRATALVYFAKGEQMQAVARPVWFGSGGVERSALAAVRWLKEGPKPRETRRGIYTAFDIPLAIRNVRFADGVATIYAPRGIYAPSPTLGLRALPAGRLRVAQIVYTLTEFPRIQKVTIVTTGPRGRQVRLRNLTRRSLSIPTGNPPDVELPPWEGPQPGDIRSVQEGLAAIRFMPQSGVSGSADYRTQQSLYAFQAWFGLDRSGVADDRTVAKLRAVVDPARIPRAARRGPGRHAEVYRDKGVLLLVEDGEVIRAVHISSGAGGRTPAGSFSVYRKESMSWSVPFSVWLPYASYFTGGIAFHSYPDVPPYPASHGCVRTSAPEAPFVYEFLTYGTPVYVY